MPVTPLVRDKNSRPDVTDNLVRSGNPGEED